ncbi:MAG: DUF6048 family protein [Paludibacteraceae bacterium]|nr:DUF6048 family protein [Paludibacteraceae bacterium]
MRRLIFILPLLLSITAVNAKVHVPDSVMHKDGLYVDNMKIYSDSAIFQGVNLKLDILNPIIYNISSKGEFQTFEMALNVRLKNRFYPTLEMGYAKGQLGALDAIWKGEGGWGTVGMDINGLKKNIQSLNALVVGVRVGVAMQQYDLKNIPDQDGYWPSPAADFTNLKRTECWGEVVGGCQVNVCSGLMMGWYVRLKLLFTRKAGDNPTPYYVPGFGYRSNTQWGVNYYIGWKF